jgi:hypothetical protein
MLKQATLGLKGALLGLTPIEPEGKISFSDQLNPEVFKK